MLENYDWGFSTLNNTNNGTNGLRTPLIVSDLISQDILGRVFCDLGCAEGDFALCCKRYASQVIGVERDTERAEVARMKGLNVITGDILCIELPIADVYYCWIGREALKVYEKIPSGKKIIFGIGNPIDMRGWLESLPNVKHKTLEYIRETMKMTWNLYITIKE